MSKILIADDVPMMRELLTTIMELAGHEVFEAKNGHDILRKLDSEGPFDLMLVDIEMPGLDGIGAVRKLNEYDPTHATKVCFISGSRDKSTVLEALKQGGDDYIVKPIDRTILLNKVERLIGGEKQNLATLKANIPASLVNAPFQIPFTIVEISEEHFILNSPIPVSENSMIDLISERLDQITGTDLFFSCKILSCKGEAPHYTIHCEFVGFHETDREKVRRLVIKGAPLV